MEVAVVVLTVISTIAAIIAAYIAWKQLRGAKKELYIDFIMHPTSLLKAQLGKGDVSVHFQEKEIESPHISIFRIQNTGTQDISSSDFDDDRGIYVNLDGVVTAYAGEEIDRKGMAPKIYDGSRVEIGPDLIKRGESFEYLFLTEGHPRNPPSFSDHLIDVKVHQNSIVLASKDERERQARRRRQPYVLAILVISVGLLIFRTDFSTAEPALTYMIGFNSGATVFVLISFVLIRIVRRRKNRLNADR
ncbi:hypothetical protein [Glycomyces sp. NPDC021274]|uniref:hypothetical protein n=1 Tax=Glycomyces sp. NPDC021274 TaxID=3155120 RepID=UPI0033F7EEB2